MSMRSWHLWPTLRIAFFDRFVLFFRVERALTEMNWTRVRDQDDKSWRLKWVDCKSGINFKTFREGEDQACSVRNPQQK